MESIGAQVWLVAYDVGKGAPRGGRGLGYAIAGGLLCDLLLRGKIGADGDLCRVIDPAPLGCPALDDLLARMVEEVARPRSWLSWVRGYAREAPDAVVEELEEHGRLVRYERRVFGLLALPRHSLADPMRADRLGTSIREALRAEVGTPCEPRLAALASLVAVTGVGGVLSAADRLAIRIRGAEVDSLVPPGVRPVVDAVRAAHLDAIVTPGAAG